MRRLHVTGFIGLLLFILIPTQVVLAVSPLYNEADINTDGIVDLRDYSILVSNFFQTSPEPVSTDINTDGIVDLRDYSILVSNFFQTSPQPSAVISAQDGQYTYIIHDTQQTETSSDASDIINSALTSVSSGDIVHLSSGEYLTGQDEVFAYDVEWIPRQDSISINNTAVGVEGVSSEIRIPYPAPDGIIASYEFPEMISVEDQEVIGFWFRPSIDLSSKEFGSDAGSPIRILLDDDPDCSSPEYDKELYHPEWVEAEWKFYRIPSSPAGSSLPSSLAGIRAMCLAVFENPDLPTPDAEYFIVIDDFHMSTGSIKVPSGVRLIGDGPVDSIIKLNPHTNLPVITVSGSGAEIAYLQIDGSVDSQDSIDQSMGIYGPNSGYVGHNIHHTYIHHTKGGGIKLRGSGSEIHENRIEWTENANIEMLFGADDNHVHHNTLKYPFNDDNIWIVNSSSNIVEHNELFGITESLLSSGKAEIPVSLVDTSPKSWNGIRGTNNVHDTKIQFNSLYDIPGYAMQFAGGTSGPFLSNTISNNYIENPHRIGISAQNGSGVLQQNTFDNNELKFINGVSNQRGIYLGGYENEISNNWTSGFSPGLYISSNGDGNYGTGNFFEGGIVESDPSKNNSVIQADMPPVIPSFESGASWQLSVD